MLVNFLFVRILIPHILLQPSQVGIGSAHVSKVTALNLKNLATTFYHICALLSPLPPVVAPSSSNTVRRASVSQVSQETGATSDADNEQVPGESTFFSIEVIGQRLVSNANFPVDDPRFRQFAQEQQVRSHPPLSLLFVMWCVAGSSQPFFVVWQIRLDALLRKLRSQIHKP